MIEVEEVYPFTVLSWNSRKIKNKWQSVFDEVRRAGQFAEYQGVKRGLRKCDVYHLHWNNYDESIKKVFDDGLVWQPILRSKSYSGFGHVHYTSKELGTNTFVYGVVARNLEDAREFADASVGEVDHGLLGQMLGYDDGCIDWFLKAWLEEGRIDPMYETALETEGHEVNDDGSVTVTGDPKFNRLIRYWGASALPHFTCSFDCPEAAKFLDWFWPLMVEYAPDECEMLLEALSMPMEWSMDNLIIYVKHPLFRAAANGYSWSEKLTVHWR